MRTWWYWLHWGVLAVGLTAFSADGELDASVGGLYTVTRTPSRKSLSFLGFNLFFFALVGHSK